MRRFEIRSSALVAALGILAAVGLSLAQVNTDKPIPVKKLKPRIAKFKGTFLHANSVAITVRSGENGLMIRTFTLSPDMREKMQKIVDRGVYQYGDKVEIQYEAGTDVAVKIKGKPSKPI